jgi:hypothetical protein
MSTDTVAITLMGPEVTVLGDLMTRHADLDSTISITDVLGRRVVIASFLESSADNQMDRETHAYLITYRYDMEAKRFIAESMLL